MHFEWGPLLNLFLIHVVGQVFESMPEASMGCPWVGQNERKKDKSGKVIVGRSIHNQYLHKNLSFLSGFKSTQYMSLILWSKHGHHNVFEIRFYQIKNLIVLLHCYIYRRKVSSSYGLTAHKGSNLKLYLSRFQTYNIWIYTCQQAIYCHYNKLVKDQHVCANQQFTHTILNFYSNKSVTPREILVALCL